MTRNQNTFVLNVYYVQRATPQMNNKIFLDRNSRVPFAVVIFWVLHKKRILILNLTCPRKFAYKAHTSGAVIAFACKNLQTFASHKRHWTQANRKSFLSPDSGESHVPRCPYVRYNEIGIQPRFTYVV